MNMNGYNQNQFTMYHTVLLNIQLWLIQTIKQIYREQKQPIDFRNNRLIKPV